jgi:prepilin-type N-terminal cleavage/methylation domain-containing protein
MLNARRTPAGPEPEAGFTLIELMVVVAIMSIVLLIAGSALISLTTTTNRGSAMVTDEQEASTVMAQLAKDIRSANSISYPSSTPQSQTPNLLVLKENVASGGYQSVEWLYQPDRNICKSWGLDPLHPSPCLVREVQPNGPYSANGPYSVSGFSVSRVVTPLVDPNGNPMLDGNGQTIPLFSYYNQAGGSVGTDPGTIGKCTTRVQVNLEVAPSQAGAGIRPFIETEDVTITDQIAILSQPGNGQC